MDYNGRGPQTNVEEPPTCIRTIMDSKLGNDDVAVLRRLRFFLRFLPEEEAACFRRPVRWVGGWFFWVLVVLVLVLVLVVLVLVVLVV